MPSPKVPKVGGDGALLKTWRQEGSSGKSAKLWLIARRTISILIAFALVGWLAYLVFSPMFLPKTFFAYFCADDIEPLVAPPIEFINEDFVGFTNLQDSLTPVKSGDTPLLYRRLVSSDGLDKRIKALQDSSISPNGVLIVFVSAHGIVRGDKAYLICNDFDPAAREEQNKGLYEVSELLQQLDSLPGDTKLLLLDAGRCDYAPRLGMTANTFAEKLKQEVEELNNSSVWVLSANSPGEKSHASYAMQRSVFGYLTSMGLQGAADRDENGDIQLQELYDFVRVNVPKWVKEATGDRESQTPVLLGGNSKGNPHLLYTASLPEIEGISKDTQSANESGFRENVLAALADFAKSEEQEFGIDLATSRLPTFGRGEEDEEEKSTDADADAEEQQKKLQEQAERDAKGFAAQVAWVDQAWELTQKIEKSALTPITYAPDLWRLHLDRLLWLESLLQSGVRGDDTSVLHSSNWLSNELLSLTGSLEDFNNVEKVPPTEPENVIDRIRLCVPTVPLTLNKAPTLALAEAIAAADPRQSLPTKLPEFVKAYDNWLTASENLDFLEAIMKTTWDDTWDEACGQYYEFELLDTFRSEPFRSDPDFSLDTIKLALQVRRLGERVTADLLWGQGWAVEATRRADQLRLEAERLLIDHASADWKKRSVQNLQQASRFYHDAQDQLSVVRRSIRLQQELLSQARDYLRWYRYSSSDTRSGAPNAEQFMNLFATLSEVQSVLDAPSKERLPNLRELERLKQDLSDALPASEADLADDKDDSEKLGTFLKFALLSPEERIDCRAARLEAEQEITGRFEIEQLAPTTQALAVVETSRNAEEQTVLEKTFLETFNPTDDGETTEEVSLDSAPLDKQLSELPGAIRSAVTSNANLADADLRAERIEHLRRAILGLNLVDALDSVRESESESKATNDMTLAQLLTNAEWFDLLRAARERYWQSQADAPRNELEQLEALANRCGALAQSIPFQTPLTARVDSRLELKIAQPSVELVTDDQATINLTVTASEDMPVWIMAQYDGSLINVSSDRLQILQEDDVLDAAVNTASPTEAGYPYRPAARRDLPETLVMQATNSREIEVLVKRVGSTTGNANLIFRAIGPWEYIREQVPVRLPGRDELQISVVGGKTSQGISAGELELYANRLQELTLEVANKGDKPKSLVASLKVPQQPQSHDLSIPTGSIESAAADQILWKIGRLEPLAEGAVLALSPGSSPKRMSFDLNSPENKPYLGAKLKEGEKGIPLPYGLLLDLVDKETNEHIIRWIKIKVLRPRAFLKAQAEYDPGTQRLTVTVSAKNRQIFPDGEVKVQLQKLEIDGNSFALDVGALYEASLKAPNYEAELQVTLNGRRPLDFDPQAEDYLPIRVHVDGYPRGFEFHLPETASPIVLQPEEDVTAIRIISPQDQKKFPATPFIMGKIEVDTPEGFDVADGSSIQVGVDKKYERELTDDDDLIVRETDRDVKLFARAPAKGGTLAIEPTVGDYELELTTAGISGRAVNVIGQIITNDRISAKDYIDILLDGEGPTLRTPSLGLEGTKLVAEVNPTDSMTGIEMVQGAFDAPAEKIKWIDGKRGVGGQWFVELETAELAPGEYTVWLKARDEVRNESKPERVTWTKSGASTTPQTETNTSTGDSSALPKAVKNQVRGKIAHGRNPVSNITVTLTGAGAPAQPARVSEGGLFDFGLVPPGTYTLNARGLSGGNYHKTDQQITVGEQPNVPVVLEVVLK